MRSLIEPGWLAVVPGDGADVLLSLLAGTGSIDGGAFLVLSALSCVFSLHLLSEAARTVGRPATFYSVATLTA